MPRKKKSGAAAWVDRDDAPELTDKFFDRAEIRRGEKVIRRGRPPLPRAKSVQIESPMPLLYLAVVMPRESGASSTLLRILCLLDRPPSRAMTEERWQDVRPDRTPL